MVDILIENALIITNDSSRRVITNGFVAVEKDRIVALGRQDELKQLTAEKRINAKRQAVIPGLVNSHTHLFEGFLRGLGRDMDLLSWLQKLIFPLEGTISQQDVYDAVLLTCVEAVMSGTTCVVDNHYVHTDKQTILKVADAIQKVGLRGVIARGIKGDVTERARKRGMSENYFEFDSEEEIRITEECIKELMSRRDSKIQVWPAPLNITFVSPELFKNAFELAKRYNVGMHTHLSETEPEVRTVVDAFNKRPVELLSEIGVLFPKFQLAHSVWLSEREMDLIASSGASVVYNPISNMYLAAGFAPIADLMKRRITIALGSDGAAENTNMDMFDVIKIGSLVQKSFKLDEHLAPVQHLFEMATIGGARSIGLEKQIGSIELGKKADLAIIDLTKPHNSPVLNPIASIGYSSNGGDVVTTIIDGKIVMENRNVKNLNVREIVDKAQAAAEDLIDRAGIEFLKEREWTRYYA